MKALIIGGTHGLGWELTKQYRRQGYQVVVTGTEPRDDSLLRGYGVEFKRFKITSDYHNLVQQCLYGIEKHLPVDIVVYAAGFFQKGKIDEISVEEIMTMINVGLSAPAILLNRILQHQKSLSTFLAITSTSQWTARLEEPVYTAVKAGLAMLAKSLSVDDRIQKTLVVAPAGMKTEFWKDTDMDTSTMLESEWVAERILQLFNRNYRYQFVKILREPPRVETVDAH